MGRLHSCTIMWTNIDTLKWLLNIQDLIPGIWVQRWWTTVFRRKSPRISRKFWWLKDNDNEAWYGTDELYKLTSLIPPFKAEKNNTVFALVLLINKAIIPNSATSYSTGLDVWVSSYLHPFLVIAIKAIFVYETSDDAQVSPFQSR